MNKTITFKEHLRATLLVLALIAAAAIISIVFSSSTPITKTENNTITNHQRTYPDSIRLRIEDFKYYWVDDIRNREYNYEFIVETGFNNGVDYEHVTQAMFNKRYDIHTIEYHLKHNKQKHERNPFYTR